MTRPFCFCCGCPIDWDNYAVWRGAFWCLPCDEEHNGAIAPRGIEL